MSTLQQNLCILFADVSGSNRLYEKLGDAEAAYAVDRCIKRMERAVAVHSGRIVKIIGDELMAVFGDAESAVQAACEIQERIDALPPVSGAKLSIRAGLHCGPAVEENNDVFGETVNIAARMISLAKGGQIVTTATTAGELPPGLRETTRPMADQVVKSKSGEIPVCELIWRDSAELRQRVQHRAVRSEPSSDLRLRHAGIEVPVDGERETLSFGRDAGSDLIVADRRASRNHARIERRGSQYVLVDQSTNGTYVTFQGELEFALKNEEIPLRGRGRIAFGHSSRDSNAEIVEFDLSD
jgi:class 3 adenylate cyclase